MVKIVGVRFRNAGKVYYFDPKGDKIKAVQSRDRGDGTRCRIRDGDLAGP